MTRTHGIRLPLSATTGARYILLPTVKEGGAIWLDTVERICILPSWIQEGDSPELRILDPRSILPAMNCFHISPKTRNCILLLMDTQDTAVSICSSLNASTARQRSKTS